MGWSLRWHRERAEVAISWKGGVLDTADRFDDNGPVRVSEEAGWRGLTGGDRRHAPELARDGWMGTVREDKSRSPVSCTCARGWEGGAEEAASRP
mmetsp:Transcript_9942/g.28547  ORF Transcript_9942/g.28547 Transcript_9942/m.28547 type:complete len:95 (+) Transcript_9942:87-371(+)